ncbi:hypothetical protein Tco_0627196 [Tanacetum coccineum]|uniref:Tf2-1-like SH3-like domain-containing protein n=1 Tax=Tanacetum coccineum TaxID=301880 RepID=A0ABQ4WLU1_9ASTR
MGPFEVVEQVGPVAYRLHLPQELVGIHDTFHVSNLKKCLADLNLHVPLEEIRMNNKLRFVEEPIEIINREVKKLKQSWIPIGKTVTSVNFEVTFLRWKLSVIAFEHVQDVYFLLSYCLLGNALGITLKDSAHPFVPPPAGKTSGSDKPRHPALQMLWGVVTGTNVDYVELIWEEFIQAIKNFFSDIANLKLPTKKPKPSVISYCRFSNKGGVDEVLGMPIPKDLITDAIRNLKVGRRRKLQKLKVNLLLHLKWKMMNTISREGSSENSQKLKARGKDDTSANVVHDTSSPTDSTNNAKTSTDMEQSNSKNDTEILNVVEEQGGEVSNMVALDERTVELDEGQAGSDPGKTPES